MKRAPVKPIQLSPDQIHEIQQAVFRQVEPQLEARFFLVDVAFEKEMGYWYLRLYVDLKEGSISISECEQVSRALELTIETIPQLSDLTYSFEVSSPGLFRPLKTVREFNFYQGEPVRITGAAEEKNKKKGAKLPSSALPVVAEGVLQGFEPDSQQVKLKSPSDGKSFEVTLAVGQAVYLNPVIRFPEEEDGVEDSALEDSEETVEAL